MTLQNRCAMCGTWMQWKSHGFVVNQEDIEGVDSSLF